MVLFSDMNGKGKRYFCLEDIESIPKQKHARVVEPMELKPVRPSADEPVRPRFRGRR